MGTRYEEVLLRSIHGCPPRRFRAGACAQGGFGSSRGRGIQRIVFNEAVAAGPRGDQFSFDFVVEAWLGDPNEVSDHGALLRAAVEAGLDPKLSRTVLAEEKVIKPGSAPVKGTFLSKRKPGTSVAEYQSYWRNQHAEIIQAQHDFFSFVRAYVQNHFLTDPTGRSRESQ